MTATPFHGNFEGNIIADDNRTVGANRGMTTAIIVVRENGDDTAADLTDKSIYPASEDFVAHRKILLYAFLIFL